MILLKAHRSDSMTNAEEKRINRIAERKGFRLDKAVFSAATQRR